MSKIHANSVLKLYRDLLRYGKELTLTDKTYYRERIRNEFKKNKNLVDETEITYAFEVERCQFTFTKIDPMMLNLAKQSYRNIHSSLKRLKHVIDYSRVPVISENDLEERFVRGSGPGGQSVNKTANCVVLKHIPSGIVVKCHESRLLQDNQKLARKLLATKLDNLINGEHSVEAQKNQIEEKKRSTSHHKREKIRMLKEQWKQENEIVEK